MLNHKSLFLIIAAALFLFRYSYLYAESLEAPAEVKNMHIPYVTGVRRIDTITVLNSYAVRWRAGENMILQLSIDEDSFTYAAADITFSLRCAYTF